MYIYDPAGLEHELPYQTICNALINIANVDRSLLVLFPISRVRTCIEFPKLETMAYQCLAPDILSDMQYDFEVESLRRGSIVASRTFWKSSRSALAGGWNFLNVENYQNNEVKQHKPAFYS